MGIKNIRAVYEIPPGMITADERLVLFVLAEQTNDSRYEWAHDRTVVLSHLGLDPDQEKDQKWYTRRLTDLEEAGFITRRQQRRDDKGYWHRQSIKLEFKNGIPWDCFSATKRSIDGRKAHLARYRHQFTDDDRELATNRRTRTRDTDTDTNQRPGSGQEPENTTGQEPEVLPGHHDLDHDITTTIAAWPRDEDFNLEDEKRRQLAALKALTEKPEEPPS